MKDVFDRCSARLMGHNHRCEFSRELVHFIESREQFKYMEESFFVDKWQVMA